MLTRAIVASLPEHDLDSCTSQPYAIAEDAPLPGDIFDCLRCQYTFTMPGSAHLVGTEWGFPRALCGCCWQHLLNNPRALARARRRWTVQGITFSPEETALQTVALRSTH